MVSQYCSVKCLSEEKGYSILCKNFKKGVAKGRIKWLEPGSVLAMGPLEVQFSIICYYFLVLLVSGNSPSIDCHCDIKRLKFEKGPRDTLCILIFII